MIWCYFRQGTESKIRQARKEAKQKNKVDTERRIQDVLAFIPEAIRNSDGKPFCINKLPQKDFYSLRFMNGQLMHCVREESFSSNLLKRLGKLGMRCCVEYDTEYFLSVDI